MSKLLGLLSIVNVGLPSEETDGLGVAKQLSPSGDVVALTTPNGQSEPPAAAGLSGTGSFSEEHEGECEFPMVGRLDYRSHWITVHFMRGIVGV